MPALARLFERFFPCQAIVAAVQQLQRAFKNHISACWCDPHSGVLLRIWLKQGKEKRLLARILEILEKARKRLSRQNSTKKCVNVRKKDLNFTNVGQDRAAVHADVCKSSKCLRTNLKSAWESAYFATIMSSRHNSVNRNKTA